METRSGDMVSPQIGRMGVIDCSAGDFRLANGQSFNIKNDGDDDVVLQVQLASMADDDSVETTFATGWNPEIVRCVKQSDASVNLKWGY